MAKDRPPSYTPAPELPNDPELRLRFAEIVKVLAQTETVSGAARTLTLSRNHFQTILHRVIAAMIEELTPKPAGRPSRPEREIALEAENEQLRAQIKALQDRAEMIERVMGVVGGIASGRTPIPRSRGRAKKTTSEDPEPRAVADVMEAAMSDPIATKVPTAVWARIFGRSESTIRRRLRPVINPSPEQRVNEAPEELAAQRVRTITRETHGQVGAASLAKTCGVTRRRAAAIKKRELREMERERKANCRSVSVLAPGLVRGFDAMHVRCLDGKAYWLVTADAAVPYRTSIATVPVYDADHVIEALIEDFDEHGPPIVLRLDRIACHRTPEIEELLRRYEVLALHGPPRHPCFYGQLERQNREHRAWQRDLRPVTRAELTAAAGSMRTALNTLWARPTLDWCTAQQAWERRPTIDVDRRKLREDVDWQASGLVNAGFKVLDARRLAIETALVERGLLSIKQGGWC